MAQLIHHIRQAFENGTGGSGSSNGNVLMGGGNSSSTSSLTSWFFLSSSTQTTRSAFQQNLTVVCACVVFYKCLIEFSCYLRIRYNNMSTFGDMRMVPLSVVDVGGDGGDGVLRPSVTTGTSSNNQGTGVPGASSGSGNSSSSGGGTTATSIGGGSIGATNRIQVGHYTRSVLHIGLSSVVIFWPYLDVSDGWSYKLVALLPLTVLARLLYKAVPWPKPPAAAASAPATRGDPHHIDDDVQNYTLTNAPSSLLFGPAFHTCVMTWLILRHFMTVESAVVAAATLGDGLAPIVGELFGRHIYSFPWTKRLTVEGSVVGVLLGTVVGCYFYLYMMGLPLLPLRMILMYATIATVAEGTSISLFDNLIVPVMIHITMEPVQMWL